MMTVLHALPFPLVCWLCAGAWASGAIFGWGLRETVAYFRRDGGARPRKAAEGKLEPARRPSAPSQVAAGTVEPKRRRIKRYRRGYYYSEESRAWGDRGWRRVAGWITVAVIGGLLATSAVVASMSFKSHHAAPPLRPS